MRDLVEQVAAGAADAGQARSMINTMALRQNNWTLATYCETYCRMVAMHHTVEDRSLLPQLRRADPRLAPVIDRLEREHHVIADVLQRLDKALVAMVGEPDGITRVRDELELLTDTHLSYEERELVEPMGPARHLNRRPGHPGRRISRAGAASPAGAGDPRPRESSDRVVEGVASAAQER